MTYLSRDQLESMGFAHLGANVRVSDRASVYDASRISLGDNVRIDDFCVLSGAITIERNVHIPVHGNLAGGTAGITIGAFTNLSYACQVIAQSDDYSGETLFGPDIPAHLKGTNAVHTSIGPYALLGAGTIVLPGAHIAEGVSSGARTLFLRPTEAWTIYVGSPARVLRPRSRRMLTLLDEHLRDER